MTEARENGPSLKISTSAAELAAPADVAFAGLGLALGAWLDARYFPGGLAADAVATFVSSGAVGLLYAFRTCSASISEYIAARTQERSSLKKLRANLWKDLENARAELAAEPSDVQFPAARARLDEVRSSLEALLKTVEPSVQTQDELYRLVAAARNIRSNWTHEMKRHHEQELMRDII